MSTIGPVGPSAGAPVVGVPSPVTPAQSTVAILNNAQTTPSTTTPKSALGNMPGVTTTPTTGGGTAPAASTLSSLSGEDTFLKLLVAQMKNQDPSSPMDSTAFVTELAQFNSVEQMISLNQSSQTQTSSSQATEAVGMIGKNITYVVPGATANSSSTGSGVVTGVGMSRGAVQLEVGTTNISLTNVVSVGASGSAPVVPVTPDATTSTTTPTPVGAAPTTSNTPPSTTTISPLPIVAPNGTNGGSPVKAS